MVSLEAAGGVFVLALAFGWLAEWMDGVKYRGRWPYFTIS